MTIEETIAKKLEQEPAVDFGLLFGSRASGAARPDSDWDVAVHLQHKLDESERFDLRLRLLAALEGAGRVELVVLNDAPPLLAHRALQGRILVMRDRRAYVRFFVRALATAQDARHYRELHRRGRQRRLEEGRFGRP